MHESRPEQQQIKLFGTEWYRLQDIQGRFAAGRLGAPPLRLWAACDVKYSQFSVLSVISGINYVNGKQLLLSMQLQE